MRFDEVVQDIIDNKISFSAGNVDMQILRFFRESCNSNEDFLQFQEYKNILTNNVYLFSEITEGYEKSKIAGDEKFEELANVIENISDRLDKSNVSCYSYSYYIYSFINYYICKDDVLKKLNIEPIGWTNPAFFDYSYKNNSVSVESTFGFGRYKDLIGDFVIDNNVLVKYVGKSSYVIIPNFIKKIKRKAFENNQTIRSVYIPKSVEDIGKATFFNCQNLETVILNDQITILRSSLFEDCKRLKKINLENIEIVEDKCFKECSSLKNINFKKLEVVGDEAFSSCTSISDFDFVNELKYIGNSAFKNCYIKSISLKSCNYIGDEAFYKCEYLQRICFLDRIKKIGITPFKNCINVSSVKIEHTCSWRIHTLFDNDLIKFNQLYKNLESIKVSTLKEFEFAGYKNIVDIEVFDDINIPKNSFSFCSSLKKIKFHQEISYIGECAFECCLSLVDLEIKITTTELLNKALYKCTSLKDFTFLSDVVKFGEKCLAYTNLENFNFDRSFDYLGAFCFANCKFASSLCLDLSGSKVLPGAFHGLKNIIDLKIDSLEKLYLNKLFLIFEKTVEEFNDRVNIDSLTINEDICNYAFDQYKNIKNIKIKINNGFIPSYAFKDSSFDNIKIEGKVNVIEAGAFENCKDIKSLVFDYESLIVKDRAFKDSNNVENFIDLSKISYYGVGSFSGTDITILPLSSHTTYIGRGAFYNCDELETVTLPFIGESSTSNKFKYLGYAFCECFDTYDEIEDINCNYDISSKIKNVTVLSTSINSDCFKFSDYIEVINLPNIESLKDINFEGCKRLKELNLGENLKEFKNLNSKNSYSILIDERCSTYLSNNGNVFSNDGKVLYYLNEESALSDYIDELEEIKSFAVSRCDDRLQIKENIKMIESKAINCKNVVSLNICGATASENAFYNCDDLQEIYLENGSFNHCFELSNLKEKNLDTFKVRNLDVKKIKYLFNDGINLSVINFILEDCSNTVMPINDALLEDILITNIRLSSCDFSLLELFGNSKAYNELKNVVICGGDVFENSFVDLKLEKVELQNIQGIHDNAFVNSSIDNLIINSVNFIENYAFDKTNIFNIESVNCDNYYIKDKILYGNDSLIYCFNKDIANYKLPSFIGKVYRYSFYHLDALSSFEVYHENVQFDENVFCYCNNLKTITLKDLNLDKFSDLFSDEGINIEKITFMSNKVNKKQFSNLPKLCYFDCSKLEIISDMAFANDKRLTTIDLSNSISIGDYAFYSCNSLHSLKINENCKYIGFNSFKECCFLENIEYPITQYHYKHSIGLKDIFGNSIPFCIKVHATNIPDSYFLNYKGRVDVVGSISRVGDYAFCGVYNVNIDLSRTNKIGRNAFQSCNICELDLFNIEEISKESFMYCSNIKRIKIGENLKSLGEDCFKNALIKHLEVDKSNEYFKSFDNYLVDIKNAGSIVCVGECNDNLILNDCVKRINKNVFHNNNIISIDLNNVEIIEEHAFDNCSKLKNIYIRKVHSIKNAIFNNCSNIENLEINKIEVAENKGLSSLFVFNGINEIPSSLKYVKIFDKINNNDFDMENSIVSIELPDELNKIPNNYFSKCHNLEKFDFPYSCISIGDKAFENCYKLKQLDLSNIISFGEKCFYNCNCLKELVLPFIGKNITNSRSLDYLINRDCHIEYLIIKEGSLAEKCFSGFKNIRSLVLPKNIENLPSKVFSNMQSLEILDNYSKVKQVGSNAFLNCVSLKEINLDAVIDIGDYAFSGCRELKKLKINKHLEQYGKEIICDCKNLELMEFPMVQSQKTIKQFSETMLPKLSKIIINDGQLGKCAFLDCKSLEEVILHNEITLIPEHAFQGASSLKKITANNIKIVSNSAFKDCVSLAEFNFSNVKEIKNGAFYGCSSLNKVDLSNVILLGKSAFEKSGTVEVTLSAKLKKISESLFAYSMLQSIYLPEGLEIIDSYAFAGTYIGKVISEFKIPQSVCEVGEFIFKDARAPTVIINKNQLKESNWNKFWDRGCKRHGFLWTNTRVNVKFK